MRKGETKLLRELRAVGAAKAAMYAALAPTDNVVACGFLSKLAELDEQAAMATREFVEGVETRIRLEAVLDFPSDGRQVARRQQDLAGGVPVPLGSSGGEMNAEKLDMRWRQHARQR